MDTLKEYCKYSFKLDEIYNNFHIDKTDELFLTIHSLKGLCLGTKNEALAKRLHLFENELLKIKNSQKFDFDLLKSELSNIVSITRNTLDVHSDNLSMYLRFFVSNISEISRKKVRFILDVEKLDLSRMEIGILKDILNPLLINALDHGIELPEERLNLGKHPKGRIFLHLHSDEKEIHFTLKDDGCGIKLRSRLPSNSILSGRKLGLRLVQWHLSEYNGSIDINNNIGRGTEISITLPRIHRHQEVA